MIRIAVGIALIIVFFLVLAVSKEGHAARYLPWGITFFLAPSLLLISLGVAARRQTRRGPPGPGSQPQATPPAATGLQALSNARATLKEVPPHARADRDMLQILILLCEAYARNDAERINRLEPKATRIGEALDRRGGIEEMRRVFALIPAQPGKRTLEMHWGGIGEWRG
jgi:hypothetical protein